MKKIRTLEEEQSQYRAQEIVKAMHRGERGRLTLGQFTADPGVYACPIRTWRFAQALARYNSLPYALTGDQIKEASAEAMSKPAKQPKQTLVNKNRKLGAMGGYSIEYIARCMLQDRRDNKPLPIESYAAHFLESGCVNRTQALSRLSGERRLALGLPWRRVSLTNAGNCFSAEIEFVGTAGSNIIEGMETDDGRVGIWDSISNSDVEFAFDGSVRGIDGTVLARYQEARVSCRWGKVSRLFAACREMVEAGGTVNRSCGLHIHLDARHLSASQERARRVRLVTALKWLSQLVPLSRRNNEYCILNQLGVRNSNPRKGARFQAVNPTSYSKHGTTEIRLGSGSIDPDKILNWATLLKFVADSRKKYVDFASFLSSDAPEHIKIWAVLRRNKFSPAPGNAAEGSE
jgi:hypothetical protein